MRRLLTGLTLAMVLSAPALAEDLVAGPVKATVIRVIDGDSIEVEAQPWLGQTQMVIVRLRGVDTPELRGKCELERDLAGLARDRVGELVDGRTVFLSAIGADKYAGRVVASVAMPAGDDLANLLIEEGLGRPYDGGRRESWCPAPAVE